jgi:hypothetical protein
LLRPTLWTLLFLVSALSASRAEVGLLMEQPYGKLGALSPTGHAALYLSRVCTETPVKLRRCRPGEAGVVISRYARIRGYDWIAIPIVPYLYAVDHPSQIPASITPATATRLRDDYRRAHLEALAPDRRNDQAPVGEWTELVGSAYRRTIYVFEIQTSPAQDDRLIQELNARPNRRRFNFFFRNCANFAESVLNFYFPHVVHRSFTADFGLTTPKQIAKSLVSYGQHQNELRFSMFVVPQVPGTIQRSGNICGVVESLVKKKQFAIPLLVWQPYFTAALVGTYLVRGRFNPARDSIVLNENDEFLALMRDAPPAPARQEKTIEQTSFRGGRDGANSCNSVTGCNRPAEAAMSQISGEK